MEVVERKRSRGGFLNLFDWPGKSRKKLFSSQLTEESKQTEQNLQNVSKLRLSLVEVDETVKSSSYNPRSDSSCCASSVSSDDGKGTRAPSVVARLMGLESLPIPNVQDPRFNPDLDPFFLRPSRNTNGWDAYENLGYVNIRTDYDGVSWGDHLDSRTSNGRSNRPVERFRSETFPPRSAKPICVTNNRLLSPIRSPGFVPSKNPVYVMEAASRMIKPSPRVVARTRFSPSDSPSSVPMRIQDLREKLEAAQKASCRQISNDTFNLKYPSGKGTSTLHTTPLTSKGKVKPPFVYAQGGEASSTHLSGNRKSGSLKDTLEAKKRGVKGHNGLRGPSIGTEKSVLKQKQNYRDNQPSVTSVSNKKSNKVVNKVPVESRLMSKKSDLTTVSGRNDASLSLSRKKTLPRGKKLPNGGLNTGKDDRKKDMDVISFTFSSPIKGLSSDSLSSIQGTDQDEDSAVSSGMTGGDSINGLLEQKLRELTSKLEYSCFSLTQEESSDSIIKSVSSEYEKSTQNGLDEDYRESEAVSDCTSFYDKQKLQMIRAKELEVSTEKEGDASSKSFSDFRRTAENGIMQSLVDQELTLVSSDRSHQVRKESDLSESVERLDWEVEFVSEILGSDKLMAKEFALGVAIDILPASVFDEMESQGEATAAKTERKLLFDFVNRCLANKCEQMFMASFRGLLGKGGFSFEQRDRLVAELNRQIHGLEKMRGMMMDELVDKDMSSLEGRWLDFERERYEEGIDMEGDIVSTLVDDLVNDLLH